MLRKLIFKKRQKEKQLDMGLPSQREPDRNAHKGGRSFYFFDFDDNIAFLDTPIYLFHKKTGKPLRLSSGEYAKIKAKIGTSGTYSEFELQYHKEGSFKGFRDRSIPAVAKVLGADQNFVDDVKQVLKEPTLKWQGPAWSCFYHAVFNRRPISLITARGHNPQTIKAGISQFVKAGHLPNDPNFFEIYPVNNPETQGRLGFSVGEGQNVSLLKRKAIRLSVESAFQVYGESPYHRFGMSDDDPSNLEMILEEMASLKKDFPKNSFFVISTYNGRLVKKEVFSGYTVNMNLEQNYIQLYLL